MATSVPVPMAMPRSAWRQGRGVVDAVADHRDDVPGRLQRGDLRGLLRGQHVGEDVRRCRPGAATARGGDLVVAGQHPHLEAQRLQLGDRLGRLGRTGSATAIRPASSPSTAT